MHGRQPSRQPRLGRWFKRGAVSAEIAAQRLAVQPRTAAPTPYTTRGGGEERKKPRSRFRLPRRLGERHSPQSVLQIHHLVGINCHDSKKRKRNKSQELRLHARKPLTHSEDVPLSSPLKRLAATWGGGEKYCGSGTSGIQQRRLRGTCS